MALEFWFDFTSTYSYIGAMRVEDACKRNGVTLVWRAFLLGPIFKLQGWDSSPFVVNPIRGNYMWRDMERLTRKYGLPWKRPSAFPRNTTLAARIAAAYRDETWIASFIKDAFVAHCSRDALLNEREVVEALLEPYVDDPQRYVHEAVDGARKTALRAHTEEAIARGIFGAPTLFVGDELFWGEETLEDAAEWARLSYTAGADGDIGTYFGPEL